MNLQLYSGIGNRFLLIEAPEELSRARELARRWCAPGVVEKEGLDGLLVLTEDPSGRARMVIWNADGSRPEACGNGLRCLGWHLLRQRGEKEILIETDSGQRLVRLVRQAGDRAELYTGMGTVEVEPLQAPWPRVPRLLAAYRASVGNPHATLLLEDERGIDAKKVSEQLIAHSQFPQGVNVGLLAHRGGCWFLRVHERGVGETAACGTGACAAAAALVLAGRMESYSEIQIEMPGGALRVRLDATGRAELMGSAQYLGLAKAPADLLGEGAWDISSRS